MSDLNVKQPPPLDIWQRSHWVSALSFTNPHLPSTPNHIIKGFQISHPSPCLGDWRTNPPKIQTLGGDVLTLKKEPPKTPKHHMKATSAQHRSTAPGLPHIASISGWSWELPLVLRIQGSFHHLSTDEVARCNKSEALKYQSRVNS